MATVREYGYYIKGNQVAIVEKDTRFDNDVSSKDYGPGSNKVQWKSPLASIADGIEIQYVYSPTYFITQTDDYTTTLDSYGSTLGLLTLKDDAGTDNFAASPESLADGSFIVLKNAGRWNGLHKVKIASGASIVTYTPFSGNTYDAGVPYTFEETVSLYYTVDVLNDEDDNIDLPDYLSRALVYYVKARMMEDQLNLEGKEYFMREFKRMIEKYNNTRVAGMRIVSPGAHAIR